MAGFMDFFNKLKDEAGSVANGVGQAATSTLYGFDSAAKSAAGGLAGLIGNVTGNQSFQHAASDLNSQAAGERAFMNQNPVTQTAGRIGSFVFAPSAASNTLQGLGIGINTAGNVLGAGIRANPTLNNVANEAVLSPVGRNVISPLLTGLATPTLNRTGLSNVATTQNQAVYNNSTFKPLGIQPFQVAGQMAGDVLNYIPVGHTANILDAAVKTGAIGALSGALEPANNTQAFLGNVASNALGAAAFGGALHGITHPIQTANLVQDIGSEGKALVKSASGQIYNADSINNFAKAYQQKTNTAFRSGIAQTIAASEGGDAKATALLRRQASAIVPHAADLSEKDLRDLMRVFVGHESSPQVVNRLAKSLNKVYSQGGFINPDLLTGGLASKADNASSDVRTVPLDQVQSDRSAMIEKAAAKGGATPKMQELAAAYQRGDKLPPIPVYEENGKYILNKDGWNRYQAAKHAGIENINVEVQPKFEGTGTAKQALERAKYSGKDPVVNQKTGETLSQAVDRLRGLGWSEKDLGSYQKSVLGESTPVDNTGKLDSLNPTGGLHVEYRPQDRMNIPLADNITTIDKTMGGNPNDTITIYRGAPKEQTMINPGDYITTNPELAKSYEGAKNVISTTVRKGDVLDDVNEPLGEEYIYRPGADGEIGSHVPENKMSPLSRLLHDQGGFASTDLLTGGLASKLDNQAADIRTVPAEQVVSDRSAMIEKAAAKGGPTPKIKELMASYQKGDQLPPIPVYEENGKYVLNKDGWNRYQAQKYLGVKDIQVEVQPKFAGTGTAKQALERAKAGNPSGAIDPNINVAHLNIPEEAKQQVRQDINLVKDKIAQKTGGVLSNQEAISLANQTNETLTAAVGREQTLVWEAKLLKARQVIAKAASSGEVTPEYLRALQAVKTQGTDIARKLQSFSIGADPKSVTAKDTILSALMDLGHKSDTLLQAAKGVDFNDARQATAFYRQFVKPTMGEYVDAIRYSSMLSSPNTHINNAFSNALNVGVVAPLEKTVTGVLDFAHSVVTGKPRTALASEGLTYTKGAVSNIHQAAQTFVDALRGKTAYTNLDTAHMPLGNSSVAAKLVGAADNVTRLLESSDQFFTTLAKEGQTAVLKVRQAKGIKLSGDPGMLAAKDAAYRLFRQDLHDPTQGHVLDAIDTLTGQIQQARNSSNPVVKTVAKYTLPFVKTPMNIIKQGVEYSPLGLSTLPGAANKTEQLAKTIVGSSAMTATAMLVASGRTTWAAPTSAKQKDAFYAAGMQPYAVKVGNQWVSYTKLPPALGFPIAMVAALHDAQANGHLGDSQVNTVLTALAKTGQFFSDQSYLKSIGDLLATVQGDPTAFSKTISNYPTQIVPYRAALSWVERLVDPNQHMVDRGTDFLTQEFQQIAMQIPGLAATTPLRTDQAGNIVPNQNRAVNAFSPLKVTTANQANQAAYDYLQQQTQATRFANDVKKNPDLMNQYAQYQNSQTPNGTFDQQQLVLKYDKKVKDLLGAPSSTSAISKARNDTQRMSLGKSIVGDSLDGKIPQDQAVKLVGQLNLDPNELERQVIISLPDNEQAAYAYDAVTKSGANPQDLIDQKILTTSVVNSMLDQGLIDTPTADGLKTAIKAAGVKKGSVKASKPKAIKITTPKSQGKHVAFVSLSMPKGMAMTPPKLKPLTA